MSASNLTFGPFFGELLSIRCLCLAHRRICQSFASGQTHLAMGEKLARETSSGVSSSFWCLSPFSVG